MIQTYVSTGVNDSDAEFAAPILQQGARALRLLFPVAPSPLPRGKAFDRDFGAEPFEVSFDSLSVGSFGADRGRQRLASLKAKAREVRYRELGILKPDPVTGLEIVDENVRAGYQVWLRHSAPPTRVRLVYVFQSIMRRYGIDQPEAIWLNEVVDPLMERLHDIIGPGVTLILRNSSAWHSRLLHEIGRLLGANVLFADDCFIEGRYWISGVPLWDIPFDLEPGDDVPALPEMASLLRRGELAKQAQVRVHPVLQAIESTEIANSVTWPANLRTSSTRMSDAEFLRVREAVPQWAQADHRFDFAVLGENDLAEETLCADGKIWSSLGACLRLAEAYSQERILFRPHPSVPIANLEILQRYPNVYVANWDDEKILRQCGELACRTAINGLAAERTGKSVMWLSNVFYRKLDLKEREAQLRFAAFCANNLLPAEAVLPAVRSRRV